MSHDQAHAINSANHTGTLDDSQIPSNIVRRSSLMPTGALAETVVDRVALGGDFVTLTSQTLRLDAVELSAGMTITSISYVSAATPLAVGSHQYFGLYNSSRVLLRATADDTSTAWGANTVKTLNLTSTYPVTTTGLYYIAVLVDATTPPTLIGVIQNTVAGAIAPRLSGNSSSGVTSLPDPAAAISASNRRPYAYVS